MDSKKHILLIEDDETTRCICEFTLHNKGYRVTLASTIAEAKIALAQTHFDLIILDLHLPDGLGISLIPHFNSQPFLIMTVSASPQERYKGFEAGAFDYLIKPFHPGELLHRIKSLLIIEPNQSNHCIQFGKWILNFSLRTLCSEGDNIELTRGEFELLSALVNAKGVILSRGVLLTLIAREPGQGHPRTVDVLISRLRKKIENQPQNPRYILTVPELGYRLAPNLPEY